MAAARNLEQLRQYGIEPTDVKTINGQPWLSSEQLTRIARSSKLFSLIDVTFDRIEGEQVVYKALVASAEGMTFGATGVATIGEKLPTGTEINEHSLAASRALRTALAMAGLDVLKGGSVVPLHAVASQADQMVTRSNQIKRLHALAEEKGLIVRGAGSVDRDAYRVWLAEAFDTTTCVDFTEEQFELAINKLNNL